LYALVLGSGAKKTFSGRRCNGVERCSLDHFAHDVAIAIATPDGEPSIWGKSMARDTGIEELIRDDLRSLPGIAEKPMFGGLAWLLRGNLLCGARSDSMLVRLGKGEDTWALKLPGIVPMQSRGRPMQGWVRAGPDAYGDDAVRKRLLTAAIEFVRTLPAK
jgi:hypothetical protein